VDGGLLADEQNGVNDKLSEALKRIEDLEKRVRTMELDKARAKRLRQLGLKKGKND